MKSLTELLTEIEKRASEATEGPWAVSIVESVECWHEVVAPHAGWDSISSGPTWSNSEGPAAKRSASNYGFIAHARNDVPALLAVIRKLIEQRDDALERANYELNFGLHHKDLNIDIVNCDASLAQILAGEK